MEKAAAAEKVAAAGIPAEAAKPGEVRQEVIARTSLQSTFLLVTGPMLTRCTCMYYTSPR